MYVCTYIYIYIYIFIHAYIHYKSQTLGGHKQKFVHIRTQEKGAVTPQKTDPDLPISVQEPLSEAWVDGGLLQGRGH